MECSLQGSSVHGIFQARVLEQDAISYSRDLLDPGIKRMSPESIALVGRFFTTEAPGKSVFLVLAPGFFFHKKRRGNPLSL